VWVGVQHLGYHELVELRRVAQRTLDQKHVIVNNLAVRRATTEFAGCSTVEQVRAVLESAFADNEFGGYELEYSLAPVDGMAREVRMAWCKPEAIVFLRKPDVWRMDLPLVGEGKGRGQFRLYRQYSDRPLMLDINLLTRYFPGELAKALDRAARNQINGEKALVAAAVSGSRPLPQFETQA
ncbi:MAG: hypothetical protein ACXVZI_11330, partial [Terriglobales bacterium]